MGPPDGGNPNPTLKISDLKIVSTALEKIDTPSFNNIPDDISTTDKIDSAIDDTEKAECRADSIETQCSLTSPSHDIAHIQNIEEEVQNKASLEPKINLPPVSLSEVQTQVKSIKTKKAPSLNHISNKANKCFSLPLLVLLVAIFNARLRNCYFPPVWKEAEVVGIYKPGKPRELPASYRPISLLRAKAFDRVWYADLIYKFHALKVPDRLIRIIHSYNSNRHFTFRYERTHSTRGCIRAGVPLGSFLSPLLYSAYTNDIPRPSSSVQLALFADNTALYFRAKLKKSTTNLHSSASRGPLMC
ncbi:Probable RNA-directed DNA polymerase from transposon BS [Eumeta japonica]|uniref:Probable RNA-directed DNA polymerase from transposon BS n=1 Tax=Eumeta variegata TaxID=151549 RepID=A0A4C1ZWD5_EUMVA|nr:Probable RNA-directed DNA polymerase from transposon BS [Eumeta japonica]